MWSGLSKDPRKFVRCLRGTTDSLRQPNHQRWAAPDASPSAAPHPSTPSCLVPYTKWQPSSQPPLKPSNNSTLSPSWPTSRPRDEIPCRHHRSFQGAARVAALSSKTTPFLHASTFASASVRSLTTSTSTRYHVGRHRLARHLTTSEKHLSCHTQHHVFPHLLHDLRVNRSHSRLRLTFRTPER